MNTTDYEPENFYHQARRFNLNTDQPINLIRADMSLRWREVFAHELTDYDRPASECAWLQKYRDIAKAIDQAFPPID